jgi:ABC-2 type transport system ATP-binding protein
MSELYFFPKITGNEYIRLLCNARQIAVSKLQEKNIFDLPLNQYVSTYSTGMKKKLALLAILLQDNQVFLLDEPFNGIDIHSNILLTHIFQRLKSLNKTVIITSHDLLILTDICDEICLLQKGKIAQRVLCNDFNELKLSLNDYSIGDKIEKLHLK